MTSYQYRYLRNWPRFLLSFSLVFTACTAPDPTFDDRLSAVSNFSSEDSHHTPKTQQPEPYASIIQSNLAESQFQFDDNLRLMELNKRKYMQDFLPKIQPGIRADFDGDTTVTLNVTQTLYNGGQADAEFQRSAANALLRNISLISETSEAISTDIRSYLTYHENIETKEMLDGIADWMVDFLEVASARARGGVGRVNEVSVLELKLNEIQTEAALASSRAGIAALGLEAGILNRTPVSLNLQTSGTSLDVYHALATTEFRKSEFELERKRRIPSIGISAVSAYDVDNDNLNTDTGLSIDAQPVEIFGNIDLQLAEQAYELSKNELEKAIRESNEKLIKLRSQMTALESQRQTSSKLTKLALARLDGFEELFLAGSASLTEATGLADTLSSALTTEINVKFQIFDIQLQILDATGGYWGLKPKPAR